MSKTKKAPPRMTPDAYAGFLRLLLTPLHATPRPSRELEAYLRYLREADRFECGAELDRERAA